jgi:hypothetical protein
LRVHYIYIIGEIVEQAAAQAVPESMDGDTSPKHAWRMGFNAALGAVLDAFKAAEEKESVQ